MKRSTSLYYFAILAFASLSSVASAQDLPVSRTAGVIDVSIPNNQVSLVSIPLVNIVASGTITSVSGATLGVSSNLTGSLSTAASPHAIKITSCDNQSSGTNGYGQTSQITANATGAGTSTVTTANSLTPNIGDEFVIYQLETLATLFGAPPGAGWNSSTSAGTSDLVYLDSAGTLTAYFYRSGGAGGAGWKLATAASGAALNNTVIPPNRGVYVQRRAGGAAFTLRSNGVTLPGRDQASVVAGFSIINNPFTISTTLAASGIQDSLAKGSGSGNSDIIYLENAGVLTGYFFKGSGAGGTGWRLTTAASGADQGSVVLTPGKAILYQEKTGTAAFALPEPFAE
jgi:hypothetical protein